MLAPSFRENSIVNPERVVTVLAVGLTGQDQRSLREIFRHSNWKLLIAASLREARAMLSSRRPATVLCEASLPDGGWKDLLSRLSEMATPPPIVVTSLHADDWLWSEVLNLGGYDVLVKPFDQREVVRVVTLAWMHWKQNLPVRKAPQSVAPLALKAAASGA